MRLATREQTKEIDRVTIKDHGISQSQLMESAARAASDFLLEMLKIERDRIPDALRDWKRIEIIRGPGNNGGDARLMSKFLTQRGFNPNIWDSRELPESGSRKYDDLLTRFSSAGALVDGIFGIGLSRSMDPDLCAWISAFNRLPILRFAVDIPTGLDSNTGHPRPVAFRAHATCTFGLAKPGQLIRQGVDYCGKLRVAPIDFPKSVLSKVATTHFALTAQVARRHLPKRKSTSNKSTHGHVVICAGGPNTWGAGVLCARAASRTGSGYVSLSGFEDVSQITQALPDAMTSKLDLNKLDSKKVYAVGPGFGVNKNTAQLIQTLEKQKITKVILDADALTVLSQKPRRLPRSWILTPHSGEMARLLNTTAEDIEKDRSKAILEATRKYGCIVLLKGFHSLVAFQNRVIVVLSGNTALAKGGSGDVLTGIIAGLRAQGLSAVEATAVGAFMHGKIADHWIRKHDMRSLMPSDMLLEIDRILKNGF